MNTVEVKQFSSEFSEFSKFTIIDGEATERTGTLTLRVPPGVQTREAKDNNQAQIDKFNEAYRDAEGDISSIYKMAEAALSGQLRDLNRPDNDEDEQKTIISMIRGSNKDFTDKEEFKGAINKVTKAILSLKLSATEGNFVWGWKYHFETSYGRKFRQKFKEVMERVMKIEAKFVTNDPSGKDSGDKQHQDLIPKPLEVGERPEV